MRLALHWRYGQLRFTGCCTQCTRPDRPNGHIAGSRLMSAPAVDVCRRLLTAGTARLPPAPVTISISEVQVNFSILNCHATLTLDFSAVRKESAGISGAAQLHANERLPASRGVAPQGPRLSAKHWVKYSSARWNRTPCSSIKGATSDPRRSQTGPCTGPKRYRIPTQANNPNNERNYYTCTAHLNCLHCCCCKTCCRCCRPARRMVDQAPIESQQRSCVLVHNQSSGDIMLMAARGWDRLRLHPLGQTKC